MFEMLKSLIADKKEARKTLNDALINGATIEERKATQDAINGLDSEIEKLETQLRKFEEGGIQFDPMSMGKTQEKKSEDATSTMEYRKAFMDYATKGVSNEILKRANATGTSADLGILIPSTIIQEVIKGVEKIHGHLYSRVRKTNLPGGVKYPIGSFSATFTRIAEGSVAERQNAGGITGSISFGYNIGEVRVARTLLQVVLGVDAFEREFAKVIAESYVKAMDLEIVNGTAENNQCEGILTEANKSSSRIAQENIISFTATEMADWTSWQKKLFAKIPLSMRGLRPEFVMTANTWEANIVTLKDAQDRPVAREVYNPETGDEVCKFKGREVVLVEEDVVKSFDDASNNEYFGIYWVPEKAYAVNTNLEFYVDHYFDKETNQYIDKAVVINDGKVLDPKYIYLLKKVVSA